MDGSHRTPRIGAGTASASADISSSAYSPSAGTPFRLSSRSFNNNNNNNASMNGLAGIEPIAVGGPSILGSPSPNSNSNSSPGKSPASIGGASSTTASRLADFHSQIQTMRTSVPLSPRKEVERDKLQEVKDQMTLLKTDIHMEKALRNESLNQSEDRMQKALAAVDKSMREEDARLRTLLQGIALRLDQQEKSLSVEAQDRSTMLQDLKQALQNVIDKHRSADQTTVRNLSHDLREAKGQLERDQARLLQSIDAVDTRVAAMEKQMHAERQNVGGVADQFARIDSSFKSLLLEVKSEQGHREESDAALHRKQDEATRSLREEMRKLAATHSQELLGLRALFEKGTADLRSYVDSRFEKLEKFAMEEITMVQQAVKLETESRSQEVDQVLHSLTDTILNLQRQINEIKERL